MSGVVIFRRSRSHGEQNDWTLLVTSGRYVHGEHGSAWDDVAVAGMHDSAVQYDHSLFVSRAGAAGVKRCDNISLFLVLERSCLA